MLTLNSDVEYVSRIYFVKERKKELLQIVELLHIFFLLKCEVTLGKSDTLYALPRERTISKDASLVERVTTFDVRSFS